VTTVPAYVRAPAAQWDAVRAELQRWNDDPAAPYDDYLLGCVETVQWLADEPIMFDGRPSLPYPPISAEQYYAARHETVREEYHAALASRRGERSEYVRGVLAVFDWAWNGNGRPPIRADELAAG
jgi:hypothetical protein